MDIIQLRADDGSYAKFREDWSAQCSSVGDDFDSFCDGAIDAVEKFAQNPTDREWAIAVTDDDRILAVAIAIRAMQKPLSGWTLRVREVTVCPLLDFGEMDDAVYADTLIGLLVGAVKLSESDLVASNIRLHLRSPQDAVFFRAFGNSLDSKGVFASVETHGAWLTFIKSESPALQIVK